MLQTIDLTKRYEDGVLALDHLNLTMQTVSSLWGQPDVRVHRPYDGHGAQAC